MRRTPICDYMDIPILLLTTHPYVCYTQIMRFSYSCMDRAFLIHFYLLAVQIQLQLLLAFMTLSIFNLSHSHRYHMILLINPKIYVYMYIYQTLVFYLYGGKQKTILTLQPDSMLCLENLLCLTAKPLKHTNKYHIFMFCIIVINVYNREINLLNLHALRLYQLLYI